MKKIYKTVFSVTVLSEEPIPDGLSLDQVIYECDYGEFVGQEEKSASILLEGKDAVDAVYELGSEPAFFNMDENGNEIENL